MASLAYALAAILLSAALLQPAAALAPNAGLAAANFTWDDLVNTNAPIKVPRVNGTLGVSYLMMSSMPAAETSLGLVVIAPCAMRLPHTHPRANEHAMILQGRIISGWLFENNTANNVTSQAGQFVVYPQGILHWQINPTCNTALLAVGFNALNPGTVTATFNMAALPIDLQNRLFNTTITAAQEQAVGWWPEDASCIARCTASANATDHQE